MVSREGLQNLFGSLKKAFAKLNDALEQEYNEYIRDSVIKRFEFTFELLWELIKKLAESENLECYSPKSCFKLAFQMDLIKNEEVFLSMLEYRNLTVHIYDEKEAEAIYQFIVEKGVLAFKNVISELQDRLQDEKN
jgi:nucleotidyltransferase substrate binding protein (TIGR01987 family)